MQVTRVHGGKFPEIRAEGLACANRRMYTYVHVKDRTAGGGTKTHPAFPKGRVGPPEGGTPAGSIDLWQFGSKGRIVAVKVLLDSPLALEITVIFPARGGESDLWG